MNPLFSVLLNFLKLGTAFFPMARTIYNKTLGQDSRTPITEQNYKEALGNINTTLDLNSSLSQKRAMQNINQIQDTRQKNELQSLLEQLNAANIQSKDRMLYSGDYTKINQ